MYQPRQIPMSDRITARQWLRDNNYEKVADLIDQLMEEWAKTGKGTRKNWWKILAGDADGNPCVVSGRKFPVLRAAQIRQGVLVTPNSVFHSPTEAMPDLRKSNRWPRRKRPSKK
jgi:hypothetical protein